MNLAPPRTPVEFLVPDGRGKVGMTERLGYLDRQKQGRL